MTQIETAETTHEQRLRRNHRASLSCADIAASWQPGIESPCTGEIVEIGLSAINGGPIGGSASLSISVAGGPATVVKVRPPNLSGPQAIAEPVGITVHKGDRVAFDLGRGLTSEAGPGMWNIVFKEAAA